MNTETIQKLIEAAESREEINTLVNLLVKVKQVTQRERDPVTMTEYSLPPSAGQIKLKDLLMQRESELDRKRDFIQRKMIETGAIIPSVSLHDAWVKEYELQPNRTMTYSAPAKYKATIRFAGKAAGESKFITHFEAGDLEQAQTKTLKWVRKQIQEGDQIHSIELGIVGSGSKVKKGCRYVYLWRKKQWKRSFQGKKENATW